jgi:DNA-binding NarL/FixJ family response regulator
MSAATLLRLGIVDDHPVVRDGIAALLAREGDFDVVATGTSLDDARRLLAEGDLDVLLLDIRLGDETGLAALKTSRGPAVVILTAFDLPQYAEAAMRLGAAGFVLKTAPISELAEAIRRVAAGGVSFAVHPGAHVRLTSREREVLALLVDGRSNDEIAQSLRIASATVETHIKRMFARTQAASRTELASRALREGWLDVPEAET